MKKLALLLISLLAPVLFITGPVLNTSGIEVELLSFVSPKWSYGMITVSNAVALIIAIRDKNSELTIVFSLWVMGMGAMFFLH